MTGGPTLSVGLAVKNAEDVIHRCVDSVLSQDFDDLELVVSDNVSDDGTRRVIDEYARADPRVRVSANEVDVGSHENMNRVLDLARGQLFRWISSDDWLEPGCLTSCVAALRAHPEAIGVTTNFTIHAEGSAPRDEPFDGEFPTSSDPARRFERMLSFFHASDGKYDPMYGVYRRDVLLRTKRLRPSEQTDWLLSAELALTGPIVHVHHRLANRTRSYPRRRDRAAFRRRLDPARNEELKSSPRRLYRDLARLTDEVDLTEVQRRRCLRALRRFFVKDVASRSRAVAAGAWARATAGV